MTITVRIPNWIPATINELMSTHYMVSAKRKKADRNLIWTYTRHLPAAATKRRVTLTFVLPKGKRAFDPDAPQKSTGDALVHAKQLVNDSHLWVEWAPVRFERGDMATIIELEDM